MSAPADAFREWAVPKVVLFFACLCLSLFTCSAQDFDYTINTDLTVSISGYTGTKSSITIPNTYAGYPVTSIDDGVGWGDVTNVIIPNSVTNIGGDAFTQSQIQYVTIPNSVTSIGSGAFNQCWGLGSVTIPNSVTSIGDGAFLQCGGLVRVTISNSATNIGNGAFAYCTGLTSVIIPNSVTNIGYSAFLYCAGLTNVTIGTGVASIGYQAFESCQSLASAYFMGNVPAFGNSAFQLDDRLIIYRLSSATGWGTSVQGRPVVTFSPITFPSWAQINLISGQWVISGTPGLVVIVQATDSLASPAWATMQTITLQGESVIFTDSERSAHPVRFYRLKY